MFAQTHQRIRWPDQEISRLERAHAHIAGDPFFGAENQDDHPIAPLQILRPPRPSVHFLKSGKRAQAYSTGLPGFDHLLGGGLFPGALSVVIGAPGALKTSLCTQIGLSLCLKGHRTVILLADEDPSSRLLITRMYRQLGANADLSTLDTEPDHPDHKLIDALDLEVLGREYTLENAIDEARCRSRDLPPVLIVDSAQRAVLNRPHSDLHDHVNSLLGIVGPATRGDGLITLLISKANRESYQWKESSIAPIATGAESSYLESDADVLIHLSGDRSRVITAALQKSRVASVPLGSVALEIDELSGRIVDVTPQRLVALERSWDDFREEGARTRKEKRAKDRQEVADKKTRERVALLITRLREEPGLSESDLMGKLSLGRVTLQKVLAKAKGEGCAHWIARKGGGRLWSAGPGPAGGPSLSLPPFNPPCNQHSQAGPP